MPKNIKVCLFFIFAMMLTGCASTEIKQPENETKIETHKQTTIQNSKLTIEPYNISEKESMLISKTGVNQIEYYTLEGTLKEGEYIQFAVEVYENGKRKSELLTTSDEMIPKYENSIVSFGISNSTGEEDSLKLLTGTPSGLDTTDYPNNMTVSTFRKLIGEKVTLEKNKPIYLAAWAGTTKNGLSFGGNENGELPTGIDEAETVLLYRVLWTDPIKNN
ncbi:hypothetical protein [Metabacillus malikii]|uniref:Lipoprotein n=1 Tax=Metabacillus malikii TaxID=1504265 RepID=A0ABT9ZFA2_9BACI|nr:hypothetical protein [Metabacillus malikii]MDQ0230655.1 hypothetical protein [Metabacillus malikii]